MKIFPWVSNYYDLQAIKLGKKTKAVIHNPFCTVPANGRTLEGRRDRGVVFSGRRPCLPAHHNQQDVTRSQTVQDEPCSWREDGQGCGPRGLESRRRVSQGKFLPPKDLDEVLQDGKSGFVQGKWQL